MKTDVLPWTRAVSLYLSRDKRVEVLSFYEEARVRSAHAEHLVPAVLRAKIIVNVRGNGGERSGGGSSGKKGGGGPARRNKGRNFTSSSSSSLTSSSSSSSIPAVSTAILRAPAPSRRNVIARDNATCAFLGHEFLFFEEDERAKVIEGKETGSLSLSLSLSLLFPRPESCRSTPSLAMQASIVVSRAQGGSR